MGTKRYLLGLHVFLCTLFMACSDKKTVDKDMSAVNDEQNKPVQLTLSDDWPTDMVAHWEEFKLENNILFKLCNPRTVDYRRDSKGKAHIVVADQLSCRERRVFRTRDSDEGLFVYTEGPDLKKSGDTSLYVFRKIPNVMGVQRISYYEDAAAFADSDGDIFFAGDIEVVNANPPQFACDDLSKIAAIDFASIPGTRVCKIAVNENDKFNFRLILDKGGVVSGEAFDNIGTDIAKFKSGAWKEKDNALVLEIVLEGLVKDSKGNLTTGNTLKRIIIHDRLELRTYLSCID